MTGITLKQAQAIVTGALAHGRAQDMMPLLVLVLDARATAKACAAEDGTSLGRYDVAHGKANGALAMGMGSRTLAKRARDTPSFIASLTTVIRGGLVAGPGGVLVRDAGGAIIGAVGISGDIGDNDEAAAIAGIEAAGLVADAGKD
jgi:uncharacterized protein GlcG (DUF336 family)